jgi:hypothetical protein
MNELEIFLQNVNDGFEILGKYSLEIIEICNKRFKKLNDKINMLEVEVKRLKGLK